MTDRREAGGAIQMEPGVLQPVVLPLGQEVRCCHPGYEDVSFEITGYDLDAAPEPDRGGDDSYFRLRGVGSFIEE